MMLSALLFFRFDGLSKVRHVRWDPVVRVHQLNDWEEDRHSSWIFVAADRARFQKRIERTSIVLQPILNRKYQIYMSRLEDSQCDVFGHSV